MIEFNKEPDFINDKCVKYWHNDVGSFYTRTKGFNNYISWYVELPTGERSILLIDNSTNAVIYECTSLEALGTYIDMLELLRSHITPPE
jgi:hypothetical protein